MFYHHTDIQMLIFKDPSSNCVDPKMKVKTETQHSFTLLIAIAFGYHHYECCFSHIHLILDLVHHYYEVFFLVIITLQNENEMITLIW